MGIFGKNTSKNELSTFNVAWKALDNLKQLSEIKEISNTQNVLIFKHSTRCSVSRMALKQFENEYKNQHNTANYFLDLLNFKEISNEISTVFSIKHESPQILLIKNEVCVYSASHSDIDASVLDTMKI